MIYLKKPVMWLISWLILLPGFLLGSAMSVHAEQQTITLYMTVDWEGWSLDDENLHAMRDFRSRYPQIPMLHLLNPVYFLRPGADIETMTGKMRSIFLPADGHGLHLHGWRSLVESCGVVYKSEPAFSEAEGSCSESDCGYNVSLESAYSEAELERLVACSADRLVQHGFDRPTHFRAGGWQLGPKLALALKENGFTWDSSRIDSSLLLGKWNPDSGLIKMLKQLHPDATPMDQPRELLPALMQYPNNAALADYTNAAKLVEIFIALAEQRKTVMVLGFHQETADHYLPRLEEAIKLMEQESVKRNVKLVWAVYR